MSKEQSKGATAPNRLQADMLQENGVQYKYDVPMSVINRANETHDPLDLQGEREKYEAKFDGVRGRVSEIMFEQFLDDHYDEWEQYDGYQHDYVVHADDERVTIEVKQRDSLRLEWKENAPSPSEADLPVRMRDATLHSDVYVMVMFWGAETVEMVGWTTEDVVRTAEWAGHWYDDTGSKVEPNPMNFERAASLIDDAESESSNWYGWTEHPSKQVPQDVLMDFPNDADGFLL